MTTTTPRRIEPVDLRAGQFAAVLHRLRSGGVTVYAGTVQADGEHTDRTHLATDFGNEYRPSVVAHPEVGLLSVEITVLADPMSADDCPTCDGTGTVPDRVMGRDVTAGCPDCVDDTTWALDGSRRAS